MKYLLEIFTGEVSNVIIDLDAGRNVLSADSSHRYVLRPDSDEPALADDRVVVEVIRRGDDLVIEGLPAQQSLQLTEYFTHCSGDQCSVQFAPNSGSDATIITPADTRWLATPEGVALTLSSNLQPLMPEQLATAPQKIDLADATPASTNATVSVAEARESNAPSENRSTVAENASGGTPGNEPASDEGGGISTGAILGGAVGVAAIAGLASGGGGDDPSPPPQTPPAISNVSIEGNDQQVSSDEVTSNGAWQVAGTATDAALVEITIRVANNSGTQADIVRTDQFAVDANGNWSAGYATSFFSGSQAGQITLTITPVGSDGATGTSTTRTYGFSGLTTAGPGDPSAPTILTSEDILEFDSSILTEETTAAHTQYDHVQHSSDIESAPTNLMLHDEVRLPEL